MLDFRTVMAGGLIGHGLCALMILSLWKRHRHRSPELGFWVADYILQFLALLLIGLRGVIPDAVSILPGVPMVLIGTQFLFVGLERYLGKPTGQRLNSLLVGVLVLIHLWFSLAQPSLLARNLNMTFGLLVICSQAAWLTLRRVDPAERPGTRMVGIVMILICIVCVARLVADPLRPPQDDIVVSGSHNALVILIYQMLFVALTFALFLMVNHRLFVQLQADIVERQRTLEALRASEERHRMLFSSSRDAMMIIEPPDWRLTSGNPASLEMFRAKTEEALIGHPVWGLSPEFQPDGRCSEQAAREMLEIAMRDGSHFFEWTHRRLNGEVFPVTVLLARVTLEGHQFLQAAVRDITAQKKAEATLLLQSSALHAAAQGIVITDRAGNIQWSNEAFSQLTGFSADEVFGRNPRALKSGSHDDAFYREMWTTILAGRVWEGELLNRRKDGSIYDEHMTITPVRSGGGEITHFIAIKQEITERKRTERLIRETNQRMEQALSDLQQAQAQILEHERMRVLGQMASGIAHDFNNALSPILGFTELLLQRPDLRRCDVKSQEFLELIKACARDSANVVRRLRELYRQREQADELTLVDVNHLVRQVMTLTQPRWKNESAAAGAPIAVQMELGEIPATAGNESELRELLMNLVFNAVDAMPHGGAIGMKTSVAAQQIVLEVRDTGEGMSEEVYKRCFDPFFTTKGNSGTGLGLATVHSTVLRHDGTIEVKSSPGVGTTFLIRLPIRGVPPRAATEAPDRGPLRTGRLLLVEDEPAIREVFGEFLRGAGHQVELAANGREGLEKFKAGCFDLVVTDMAMPELNGENLALELQRIAPEVPVILLTGFGDVMNARNQRPVGVSLVVGKPVPLSEFGAAVQDALSGKRALASW